MTAQPRVDRLSAAETTLTDVMRTGGFHPGELAAAVTRIVGPRVEREVTDFRVRAGGEAELKSQLPLDAAAYGTDVEWVERRSRIVLGKHTLFQFGEVSRHRACAREAEIMAAQQHRARRRGMAAIHALAAARTRRQQSAQLAFS